MIEKMENKKEVEEKRIRLEAAWEFYCCCCF